MMQVVLDKSYIVGAKVSQICRSLSSKVYWYARKSLNREFSGLLKRRKREKEKKPNATLGFRLVP